MRQFFPLYKLLRRIHQPPISCNLLLFSGRGIRHLAINILHQRIRHKVISLLCIGCHISSLNLLQLRMVSPILDLVIRQRCRELNLILWINTIQSIVHQIDLWYWLVSLCLFGGKSNLICAHIGPLGRLLRFWVRVASQAAIFVGIGVLTHSRLIIVFDVEGLE